MFNNRSGKSNKKMFNMAGLILLCAVLTPICYCILFHDVKVGSENDYNIYFSDSNSKHFYHDTHKPNFADKYRIIIVDNDSCEIVECISIEADENYQFTIHNDGKKDWKMFFITGLPYITNDYENIKWTINGEEVSDDKYDACIPACGSVDFTVKYELSDVEN